MAIISMGAGWMGRDVGQIVAHPRGHGAEGGQLLKLVGAQVVAGVPPQLGQPVGGHEPATRPAA